MLINQWRRPFDTENEFQLFNSRMVVYKHSIRYITPCILIAHMQPPVNVINVIIFVHVFHTGTHMGHIDRILVNTHVLRCLMIVPSMSDTAINQTMERLCAFLGDISSFRASFIYSILLVDPSRLPTSPLKPSFNPFIDCIVWLFSPGIRHRPILMKPDQMWRPH